MDIKFTNFAQLDKADALIALSRTELGAHAATGTAMSDQRLYSLLDALASAMALVIEQSKDRMFDLAKRDDQLAQDILAIRQSDP